MTNRLKSLKPTRKHSTEPLQQPESKPEPTAADGWAPPPLSSLEDTGLSKLAVSDLVLKTLYFRGDMVGHVIAETLKLPFSGILDGILEWLRREKMVDITGSDGIGDAGYRFMITSKGIERALDALDRTQYAGAAPVPLDEYVHSVKEQNRTKRKIREEDMMRVLENLIVSKDMLDKIGPAANSGTSIFLYGPPGNGKTTLSERIGRVILGSDMWIPYAVDVDGQVIQIYDYVNHEISDDQTVPNLGRGEVKDARWIKVKRPIIVVGGELTMDGLDLTYDPINKFYEAPYQVKANGGMFLIDDFGRQQVSPMDLLNRWIVPLEKKYDYLTLNNGRKIEVPFEVMIVFSTNMDPQDLVDDAFLRRIKYKIEVGNPSLEQFRELFELMCRLKGVPFDEKGLAYLVKEWYFKYNRDFRFVHPRDLLNQLKDMADYLGVPVELTRDLIDRAAASYFVEL